MIKRYMYFDHKTRRWEPMYCVEGCGRPITEENIIRREVDPKEEVYPEELDPEYAKIFEMICIDCLINRKD